MAITWNHQFLTQEDSNHPMHMHIAKKKLANKNQYTSSDARVVWHLFCQKRHNGVVFSSPDHTVFPNVVIEVGFNRTGFTSKANRQVGTAFPGAFELEALFEPKPVSSYFSYAKLFVWNDVLSNCLSFPVTRSPSGPVAGHFPTKRTLQAQITCRHIQSKVFRPTMTSS